MSENENLEEQCPTHAAGESDPSYRYRWSYTDQRAFETKQEKKNKRHGVVTYAVVMTVVFLLCFAMLAVTLIWYGSGESTGSGSHGALSTNEVAEVVKPATVLIYASNQTSYGYGTGFFITTNGYIATNCHVVKGFTNIEVTLYSGNVTKAELVGYSEADDLAVLKISGINYPAVRVGNSDLVKVGDTAIAIGNPSGSDASWTTTQGIISALDREVVVTGSQSIEELTMIQTDAPVNPGNSGGPLCNDRGEVIGVVTRKLSDYEGIGLAIPINGAMEILNAIMEKGNADGVDSSVSKVRPTIGITGGTIKAGATYTVTSPSGIQQFVAERDGVLVSTVSKTGAAAGKLQMEDIIIAFGGVTVSDMEDLTELLYQYKVGDTVSITVWRDSAEVTVEITLGASNAQS